MRRKTKNFAVNETHFGSAPLARFTKIFPGAFLRFTRPKTKLFAVKFKQISEVFFMGTFSWFLRPKTKLLAVKFKRIFQVLCSQGLQINSGRIFTICVSKNEAVSCEVQTHFGNSLSADVAEKVLAALSRYMRPKTKLFAVKFRHILEVFTLWGLYKKLWVHYHHSCVQKRSCLLWRSDGFWKFSLRMLYKKVLSKISRFMCPKTKLFAVKFRYISEVFTLRGS